MNVCTSGCVSVCVCECVYYWSTCQTIDTYELYHNTPSRMSTTCWWLYKPLKTRLYAHKLCIYIYIYKHIYRHELYLYVWTCILYFIKHLYLTVSRNVQLTLKRRGYWRTSKGGEGAIPLWKSMFPFIYICVMHVITLFFHGAFDENIFIPISAH